MNIDILNNFGAGLVAISEELRKRPRLSKEQTEYLKQASKQIPEVIAYIIGKYSKEKT